MKPIDDAVSGKLTTMLVEALITLEKHRLDKSI